MNVSDQNNGFGTMDGNWVSSVWDNYDLVRYKLDATGYKNKSIIASESWITWDAGHPAIDVNGDGKKTEQDAYDKTLTIMGKCLERGLNTFNLPWRDNSSEWSMGLTKRRDYNGRVKKLNPEFVTPANDGGADIVTQKLALKGNDDDFVFGPLAKTNVSFTIKDYINPSDPQHLHYYLWRWYGQIACGTDEAIRHAVAGEIDNNIAPQGAAFTGNETYRLSSWNRTKEEFTVLLYASGAGASGVSWLKIPSTIQTGKYYNTGKNKNHDFRGEGIKVGENYIAVVETKNISREDGSDQDVVTYTSAVSQVNEDGTCTVFLKDINKFTKVTIRKTDRPLPEPPKADNK